MRVAPECIARLTTRWVRGLGPRSEHPRDRMSMKITRSKTAVVKGNFDWNPGRLEPVLRQNAILVYSLQKQLPKDSRLGQSLWVLSRVRDVIGLVEPLRRQAPALRKAGCSSRGRGMTGPCCPQLRSAPFIAMVQATNLWDLHDLSRLRPLHGAGCRGVFR